MLTLIHAFALQNRFAPLPKDLHILFCSLATILFLILYFRYKRLSDLLWMIACDLTLILQFYGDKVTAFCIGICELILLCLIFCEFVKSKKAELAKKTAVKAAAKTDNSEEDDLKDIEKAVTSERSKLAPESGNDIISQAFDEEGPCK